VIALDTSTLVAFLAGDGGPDVEQLDRALAAGQVCLPPVVVSEILSAPQDSGTLERIILALPRLDIIDGYWERCGRMRRGLLGRGARAPLADTLICQSCLDFRLPLLTRDNGFKAFAKHCGLELA